MQVYNKTVDDGLLPAGCVPAPSLMGQKSDDKSLLLTSPKALVHHARAIPNGTGILSIPFVIAIPSHHCMIPEGNLTQDWLNVLIPVKEVDGKQERSSCSRYKLDVVRNLSAQGLVPGRDVNVTHLEKESCLDGWTYSRDVYRSTIVTEFDLVCGEQWKSTLSSTVYFIGVLIGSAFTGFLSDRYGRRPVFFSTMALQAIFIFVQIFSPSWPVFCVLLLIGGLGQAANFVSAFVLGTEILTGKVRNLFVSVGFCMFCAFGFLITPLFAYALRDWKSLLMVVSLPCLIYIPLYWFIPESPRWLISKGRAEEAEAIVRKAAKMNNVEPPEIIFQDYSIKKQEKGQLSVIDITTSRRMRLTTPILCLNWFTLISGYYGLTLNSVELSADPYLSSFISAAVEVPAYICVWLVLQYFPRRPSTTISTLLGGASLFAILLVPQGLPELSVTLEMLGKYSFTTSSTIMYCYTAEIYPTEVRTTGCGLCSTFSRIGTCIIPFVFKLGSYRPYVIVGTLAFASAFTTLLLPETFGRPLPQTVDDMPQRESIKCSCITGGGRQKPAVDLESRL